MKKQTDPRIPHSPGTQLKCGTCVVKLGCMIAKGTGCLVYLAEQNSTPCAVKQLYPEGMTWRKEIVLKNGRVYPAFSIRAAIDFAKARQRFRNAFRLQKRFSETPELCEFVPKNDLLFSDSGAYYILLESGNGVPLDRVTLSTADQIIFVTIMVAEVIHKFHQNGWLMIDIKDSNFLLDLKLDGTFRIMIVDFDSMIPVRFCQYVYEYRCSSATAPPELLFRNRKFVGIQSEVYSIGAMLLNRLSGGENRKSLKRVFESSVLPRLSGWGSNSVEALYHVLETALQDDPKKRFTSCQELADALENIIYQRQQQL